MRGQGLRAHPRPAARRRPARHGVRRRQVPADGRLRPARPASGSPTPTGSGSAPTSPRAPPSCTRASSTTTPARSARSMVEGRISAGVARRRRLRRRRRRLDHGHPVRRRQGDHLDRRALPARRQRRHRHLARRRLRRRGRLLRHRRHQDHRSSTWTRKPKVVKALELSGASNVLFRRNSVTGTVEAVPWQGEHRAQRRPARQLTSTPWMHETLAPGRSSALVRRSGSSSGSGSGSSTSVGPLLTQRGVHRHGRRPRGRRSSVEQAENAALITAISVQRGMPARAATIALATAYQESKLYNIESGDRDSLGLFQQRPSQGWGTPRADPRPVLRDQRLLRRARRGRRLRVDADHRGRAGGAALRLPRGVRRPRGRRPGARLRADRQLAARPSRCVLDDDADEAADRLRDVRADPPRRRRTPRRARPRSATLALGGFAARRRHDGPHGGLRPLRGPRDRHLRAADLAGRTRSKGWAIAHYLVAHGRPARRSRP